MTLQFILWALSAFCMFSFVLFKISCLFKKKCSWKKCPYPFDEEEESNTCGNYEANHAFITRIVGIHAVYKQNYLKVKCPKYYLT